MKLKNLRVDELIGEIVFVVVIVAIVVAVVALSGCAATGPTSSAADWRSIHHRSPDTGS